MSRRLLRWSFQSFLVFCAVVSCALGGLIMRNNWRSHLFAQLESVGSKAGAPLRVTYTVEGRWFGLFGSDFSKLNRPTKKLWWFDPLAHRYINELSFFANDAGAPACESILRNRESLRGLETLDFFGIDDAKPLPFPKTAAKLPDVRLLRMNNVSLTRQDFESISRMPDLEILDLRKCSFEPEELTALKSSEHLAWLVLYTGAEPDLESLQKIRASLAHVYVSQFFFN